MGKNITVAEGHTTSTKTDHRSGKQKEVENKVEVRPVIEGYHNETVRDKYYFGRDFITLFQEDLYNLVKNGGMSQREWRIFMYLCSTLDRANITFSTLDTIAEDLDMDRGAVSRTLTKLKARNLILEKKLQHRRGDGPVPKMFCVPLAQLNYNIVWNGQTKNYQRVRGEHPQITTLDGTTLLNPHAEAQRQQQLREQRERESLFPEFYQVTEQEIIDPETGEVL